MNRDEENLRLLSIFHYVVAALSGLFSFFPLIYVAIGALMLCGRLNPSHPDPMLRPMGWMIIAIGTLFFLMGLAFVLCVALAGRYLSRHRHYLFCLVVAAFSCLLMPFGTVLGVFTIIVLQKESVRQLFGHASSSPPAAPSSSA